jgi:predicted alpha/beta hydrolase
VWCRVLSFGYDSKAAGQAGAFVDIALWLLAETARECDGERPIMFIAHSFGGALPKGVR